MVILAIFSLSVLVSCKEEINTSTTTDGYATPTIIGYVKVPSGSSVSSSDFYIRIMDGETVVHTSKVRNDGSFAISNLDSIKKYTVLFSSAKLGDVVYSTETSKATTSGYGLWMYDVVAKTGKATNLGAVEVETLGTISGTVEVEGASNNGGVSVFIPGTIYLATTDEEGNYCLLNVPQSTYTLYYSLDGYETTTKKYVVLMESDHYKNPETIVTLVTLKNKSKSIIGGDSESSAFGSLIQKGN